MRAEFASEIDELRAWVDAVRPLPRFLRTKDARALMDALEPLAISSEGSVDGIAERLGRTKDELLAGLRKCPFGVSL